MTDPAAQLLGALASMPATNKKAGPPLFSRSAPAKAAPASASLTKKRKMDGAEQKYYAVRAGFKPGVYTSWAICQQQISGYKGAQCTYPVCPLPFTA